MFGFLRSKKKEVAPAESPFDETEEGSWEPGIVQFALDNRLFRIEMLPGSGHGGIAVDVEMAAIPFELRMPNTRIMALRVEGKIVALRAPGPKALRWFEAYVDRPLREK
jgi:hypothetical protein